MSVELGPLPTSAARANVYRNDILCADVVSWRIRPRPEQGEYELFTADQMRAYAEAEVLKERERCAKACESMGPVMCEIYGAGAECIATADACAEAIRRG